MSKRWQYSAGSTSFPERTYKIVMCRDQHMVDKRFVLLMLFSGADIYFFLTP